MGKLKYQTRLFLYHAGIIILIWGGTVAYFFTIVFREMNERMAQDFQVIAQKTVVQVDGLFDEMDRVALQIAANPDIVEVFQELPPEKGNYFTKHPVEATDVRLLLESYNFKQDSHARICLYNGYEDFVCTATKAVTEQGIIQFFSGSSFHKVENYFKDKERRYIYFKQPSTDILAKGESWDELSFSIVREIKDYYVGSSRYGYVEVQETTGKLDRILMNLGEGVYADFVDASGRIIYSSMKEEAPRAEERIQVEIPLKNVPGAVRVYRDSRVSGNALRELLRVMLVVVVIILLFSLFLVRMLMKTMLKPLQALNSSMKAVNLENLHINIADESSEDIVINLEQSFNKMLETLNKSIEDEMVAKVNEVKSHLFALQSQMNPHFLHNMLAIIAMEAQGDSNSKIPSICQKLGEILRYTAHMGNGFSTMEEECKVTEDYLALMKIRYEEMFEYHIDIEESLRSLSIPKLILQPICENSFQHGLKYVEPVWKIDIRGWQEKQQWYLEIRDNGCGFSEAFLKEFQTYQKDMERENVKAVLERISIGGLCLPNICARFKILYDSSYVFKMYNDDKGAVVLIGGLINAEDTDCRG